MELLAAVMPRYDHRQRHAAAVAAPAAVTRAALHAARIEEMRLARVLLTLRSFGRVPRGRLLDAALSEGFVRLAERDGELVVGAVGQFWKPAGELAAIDGPDAFAGFARPGFARAAIGVAVVPDGGESVLVTETRIALTDRRARRVFAVYWALVGPGSGLVRRSVLAGVRRRAEATAGP